MTSRTLLILSLVLAASGCQTGTPPSKHPLAVTPKGVNVAVRLRKSQVNGELLEVRDSGLVVLGLNEVAFIPFARIRRVNFKSVDTPFGGPNASPGNIATSRLYSRFPAGMPESVLRQLLEERHQSELAVKEQ